MGGAVRDLLLQRPGPDLDLVVPSGGITIGRRFANALGADFMVLDEDRDTARVIVAEPSGRRMYIDVSSYRDGSTIEADLQARDFTINAIAMDLRNHAVLDPLGGATDLREKRLRACSAGAVAADPVRAVRGVRLATALNLEMESATREQIREAGPRLVAVTAERLRDELFRMLDGPRPFAAVRVLEALGILDHMLPELRTLRGVEQPAPHVYDVWAHTLATLESLSTLLEALVDAGGSDRRQDLMNGLLMLKVGRYGEFLRSHLNWPLNRERSVRGVLFFSALYHDVAKPMCRSVDDLGRLQFLGHEKEGGRMAAERAANLRLSNDEVARVRISIENHMRFAQTVSRRSGDQPAPTRRAIYRFFRDTGSAGIDVVLLGLADIRGKYGPQLSQDVWSNALDGARALLENYWEKPQESVSPPRLVDGNDLIESLQLAPGPQVGRLLERIREAQAEGMVRTAMEAIQLARTWSETHDPGEVEPS